MAWVGTTIRPPSRSAGKSPVRTHSYAVVREMPRTSAASATDIVRCTGSVRSTTVMSFPSVEFRTQQKDSQ